MNGEFIYIYILFFGWGVGAGVGGGGEGERVFLFKLESVSVYGQFDFRRVVQQSCDYTKCQSQTLLLPSSGSPSQLSLESLRDDSVGLCLYMQCSFQASDRTSWKKQQLVDSKDFLFCLLAILVLFVSYSSVH